MALKSSLEKEEFRFTWKIENFSLCGEVQGKAISSPTFTMGMLEKTEWCLKLYPGGLSDSNVSCDLYRENDSGPSSVTIHWQFSLVIIPGMPKFEFNSGRKSFTRATSTNQKLISRETLFKKKHGFLPMDTLTIQCDLWTEVDDALAAEMTPEVKSLASCLYDMKSNVQGFKLPDEICELTNREVRDMKKNLHPYLNEVTARTRISMERGTFTWPIRRFSSLGPNKKSAFSIPFPSKRLPPFAIIVYPQSDGKVKIDIRKLIGGEGSTWFVHCRIAVLDIDGRVHSSETQEYTFGNPKAEETWSFPSFFTKKELTDNRRICLPNDQLTLRFELESSTGVEFSRVEEYRFVSLARGDISENEDVGTAEEDLRAFYAEEKAHDFSLKVKDAVFPAHRAVLSFRSPVFCAMLDHDTAEKSAGVVDMSDMDPRTVSRMLEFMYTDQVELVNMDGAVKLFQAADKYQIRFLRKKCTEFLKNNLSKKNVFGVYSLADRHQDPELMKWVLNYLFKCPYETLLSVEFENFIPLNTKLASKIMQSWIRSLQVELMLNY